METDDEQVEKLKAWLKENGMSIVLGIVLGVGGIGGYNYWQQYQQNRAAEASVHFETLLGALRSGDGETLQRHADILVAEFESTDYAQMARLALARNYVDGGDFQQAETVLQEVVGSAGQSPLAYVARTRLAAVQIQNQRFEQALATLAADFPDGFVARVEELRGDALASQGQVSEARDAYRRAQGAQPGPADAAFLKQKLDDLGAPS
jgi:predicted negative regulator of RcsB-dependent stress response